MAAWRAVYRLIVRSARGDAGELRTSHAEATFISVCEAAARRGRLPLAITAVRELGVVAGVIALSHLRPLLQLRAPRPPDWTDSLRGAWIGVRSLLRSHRGLVFWVSTERAR